MTDRNRAAEAMTELSHEELEQAHGGAIFSVQPYFGTPNVRTAEVEESGSYQGKRSSGGYVPT